MSSIKMPRQQFAHCHVAAFMALPWTRLDDDDDNDSSSSSSLMIQVIHDGSLLTAENLCANTTTATCTLTAPNSDDDFKQHNTKPQQQQQQQTTQKDAQKLSLRQPMLIIDTPESIGMKLPVVAPAGAANKRKRAAHNDNGNDATDNDDNKFSIRHVADLLGNAFPVRVINVKNQEELPDWTLGDLVEYFNDEERLLKNTAHNNNNNLDDYDATTENNRAGDLKMEASNNGDVTSTTMAAAAAACLPQKRPVRRAARASLVMQQQQEKQDEMSLILNQISLEFSNTTLREKVNSPQFVRDLDWIDQAWRFPPQSTNNTKNANRSSYPAVQYYCLTSAAGCYTDFHVDFGGSSVWYNVLSGEKHFCLIPPTRHNLTLYEEWLCSPTQAQDFFAQIVLQNDSSSSSDKSVVYKIALKERQTLIIPAGWIHCVYTPSDSLVFGGNFLHGLDIETQLTVYSIEVRSRVLEQYRFPLFIQVHFVAASMYLHLLKQQQQQSSSSSRRPSLLEVQSLGRLIEAVTMWWNPATMAAATTDNDDNDSNTSLSAIATQVAAEHDCSTFQDFLTMLQEEHERALVVDVQQQNRSAITSSSAVADNDDDDKVQKAVQPATLSGNNGKSATSPRLRVKLSSNTSSSSSKVVVNATETSQDESMQLSSTAVGLVDIDSDDKFRIQVSAASRQGRTLIPRKSREKVATSVNDNDEWLPSSTKKQQQQQRGRLREKQPSPSKVAAGNNSNGQMSPPQVQLATSVSSLQQQQPAKKRAKKPEPKPTTARQRLLKKVGR